MSPRLPTVTSSCLVVTPKMLRLNSMDSGAFNRLYKITCSRGNFAMRVTLPVDPRFKTSSEAATLDLISKHTSIPVPKVIAMDNTHDNEIGFEWILMEFMPGVALENVWRTITWSAKCALVERVVDMTADLYRVRSNSIGNIYLLTDMPEESSQSTDNSLPPGYTLGRIVSMAFFWDKHIALDLPRGPFPSSFEWLSAILAHKKHDNDQAALTAQEPDADFDEIDVERTRTLIEKLWQIMPRIFPPTSILNELFALRHDDMHQKNLMVNSSGELTALVDWECVSIVPMWKVCQLPSLLEGKERIEKPQTQGYSINEDGTIDEMYWEHLEEHELTRLRKLFFERMNTVEPQWMLEYHASEAKADFAWAAENCDSELCMRLIERWLDIMIAGVEQPGLRYLAIQDDWQLIDQVLHGSKPKVARVQEP